MSISVTHQEFNGVQVLTIGSEQFSIDELNTQEISQQLLDIVVSVPPQVVIDMQHVDFYGSSFIETLFRLWNRIKVNDDGKFALCGLKDYCREILVVTNLDSVWPIYDNVEIAVEKMSAGE